jgi:3-deoxy-manno-octulosonate cytidylyltransferase (CMP-KDO synthetase)
MNFLAVIPARYASTRFPGKPLVDIAGKPMIQRVYEAVHAVLKEVVVATDDDRIYAAIENFGGNVVMTSPDHRSGTDRCAEALNVYEKATMSKFDVVVNVQGDEPFIRKEQIAAIQQCFSEQDVQIATLIKRIVDKTDIFDPNRPKVVIDGKGFALYFSRTTIPFLRGIENKDWHIQHTFYQHIGMYAYRT